MGFGNLTLAKMVLVVWSCSATACEMIVLPRISTSVTPKWPFSMVSFRPACLMQSKTALMLRMSCVTELAAMSMSSTYCAHWSGFVTLSRDSLIKLEKAERAQLRPCASRL